MLKSMVAVVILVGVVGVMAGEVAAQESERPYVLIRICEIGDGQAAAATAIAQEFRELRRNKFPGAQGNAFAHVLAPFNHMHFILGFPDLATYQSRNDALVADANFRALVQKAFGEGIFEGCTDELLRAVP